MRAQLEAAVLRSKPLYLLADTNIDVGNYAMLDMVSHINKNTDNGLVTSLASLDPSKAFDRVGRQALPSELGWYCISTHWIENYLTGRTQTVKGEQQSRDAPLGVVQGGTPGQIMFSLYTSNLTSNIPYGKLMAIVRSCIVTILNLCTTSERKSSLT